MIDRRDAGTETHTGLSESRQLPPNPNTRR